MITLLINAANDYRSGLYIVKCREKSQPYSYYVCTYMRGIFHICLCNLDWSMISMSIIKSKTFPKQD